uniref:Uncharacterized protein n=2 Tax=Lotharella globosa TaxID=91324 RepID=A0A7S3YQJ6_9EUKA
MGQFFFKEKGAKIPVGVGPVRVKKGDRLGFIRAFKRKPQDVASWPNGLHCMTCPITNKTASDKTKEFNWGYMALNQIVSKTTQGKQLAVRVMPVLIHPQAYEMMYKHVPGAKTCLSPPSSSSSNSNSTSRGYAETWDASRSFRQLVTDDFVENYSKRMAKGRKVQNHKDRLGNVVGVVFDQQATEGKSDSKGGSASAAQVSLGGDDKGK